MANNSTPTTVQGALRGYNAGTCTLPQLVAVLANCTAQALAAMPVWQVYAAQRNKANCPITKAHRLAALAVVVCLRLPRKEQGPHVAQCNATTKSNANGWLGTARRMAAWSASYKLGAPRGSRGVNPAATKGALALHAQFGAYGQHPTAQQQQQYASALATCWSTHGITVPLATSASGKAKHNWPVPVTASVWYALCLYAKGAGKAAPTVPQWVLAYWQTHGFAKVAHNVGSTGNTASNVQGRSAPSVANTHQLAALLAAHLQAGGVQVATVKATPASKPQRRKRAAK